MTSELLALSREEYESILRVRGIVIPSTLETLGGSAVTNLASLGTHQGIGYPKP